MKTLHTGLWILLAALAFGGAVGCGDDDGDSDDGHEEGGGSGGGGTGGEDDPEAGSGGDTEDAGPSGGGGSGSEDAGGPAGGSGGMGGTGDCPAIDDREVVMLEGEIDTDTTWTCDKLYVLITDLYFVTGDSTLTIEPGTVIQGDPFTGLIVTRGSRLVSKGTLEKPVVFTSSSPVGSRAPSDWGGVVLLGSAPINDGMGEGRIEGIDPTDDRGLFGGDDDASDCGSIEYTRIEFGGFELSLDNELNGLTLGACGTDTSISYLQVHHGSDDGIEVFGGSPTLDHILLTGNTDDGFDTDFGAQPQVQFIVVQQDPTMADTGFEWDNHPDMFDSEPVTMPTIWNATLIGSNDSMGVQLGMNLRRGAWADIHNAIVMGFPVTAIDVRDAESVAGTEEDPLGLTVEDSLFFENGPDGMTHFSAETGMADNDFGFVEEDFFTDAARSNVFDEDPELGDPYNQTAPDFVPADGSPAADGATPPSGMDASATYKGAFEPGGDDWTAGWSDYPED